MSTKVPTEAQYIDVLRQLANVIEENQRLTSMLEAANEHIGIAFHPEIGWAVKPEDYTALQEKHNLLIEVLHEAVENKVQPLPNYLVIILEQQFGVKRKFVLPVGQD